LLQARNEYDRLAQISTLLKEANIDVPDFFESSMAWGAICREADPERLAWKLSREIARRSGGDVPECLRPYQDRADFEEAERREDLARLEGEMTRWLEKENGSESVGPPKRSLKVLWKVNRGFDPLSSTVEIELQANSSKLREGARNFFQIRGLCHELAHRPELFCLDDASLLRWLADYLGILCTDKRKHGSPFLTHNRALLAWLQRWGQVGRCLFEDGKPVEYSPLPVRLMPRLTTDGDSNSNGHRQVAVMMDFEVALPNGGRESLENAHVFIGEKDKEKSETSRMDLELVCVRGCFYRLVDRPPLSVLALAGKYGGTRFEGVTMRRLLPPLIRRYPNLQSQVKLHLRQLPSEVSFYFSLDNEDALWIRLVARAKKGSLSWEWSHLGWVRKPAKVVMKGDEPMACLPAPAETPSQAEAAEGVVTAASAEPACAEVWDEVPAESDVRDACDWLSRWDCEPGELCGRPDEPGWWVTMNGRRLADVLKWWQDRSLKWQIFGNRRFEQLVRNRRHAFPKLRIVSSGMDWFTVKAEWEEESERLAPEDWQRLRESDDPFIKLNNGRWIAREEAEALSDAASAMAGLGLSMDQGEQRITRFELASVNLEAWSKIGQIGDGQLGGELVRLKQAVDSFQGIPEFDPPQGLRASLRPYQRQGLHFLAYAARIGLGAILADDMGLGKTVQALAWLEWMRESEGPAPCLVVCPASVVFNWQREAAQFTPGQKVLTLTAGEERHSIREEIPRHHLIITNYALLRRDLAALKKFTFRAVILDEAQNIKNPDSMVAKAAKLLHSNHRLALTGTPLENRLLDLWSIVDFVHPDYLPPRASFVEQYDRGASPQARALLASRLRPLVLRRLKRQVAQDLPDRIEERIDCELTSGQRKFYLAELQRARTQLRDLDTAAPGQGRMHVLAALTRLRQICCHPQLAGGKGNLGSGKTTLFFETLDSLIAEGHKVLVFSQFVEMLKILQTEIEERGWPYYLLTGQTTNRAELVEAFQTDSRPAIFLLSLKAAGTGLNLTSASYVVLYDPWWNPAVEAQAIDRTHRIGQDRTVIAYRLVTRDTVEEKIWQLQQQKAQLFTDVLGEHGFSGALSRADLDYLLESGLSEEGEAL
jgi:hypothetical protein